jgi:RimJ/RimL family protein N-acetyltransferase
VYDQLGCVRAQFTTEQESVARLAERLGGRREGVLRDKFGRGRDGIVIGVLEQEYRFR